MKKPKQFKIFLIAVFVAVSGSVFAQVKIGTNPTAIEAASNLEVEASTGQRKVKVDKTTGKVTIKDGSEGVNKVLTSDADGVATWMAVGRTSTTVKAIGVGTSTLLNGVNTTIMSGSSVSFTLPSDKTVFMNFIAGYDDVTQNPGYFPYYTFTIYVDGAPTDILIQLQEPGGSSQNIAFTLSGTLDLSAGNHVLDVRGIRSYGSSIPDTNNTQFNPLSQRTYITYFN